MGSNLQAGGVATAASLKSRLSLNECSANNSKDTVQDPQAHRSLEEDPSLGEKPPTKSERSFFSLKIDSCPFPFIVHITHFTFCLYGFLAHPVRYATKTILRVTSMCGEDLFLKIGVGQRLGRI